MHRLIGLLMVVYLLGDPGMTMPGGLTDAKEYLLTAVLMLVSAPWIRAQFD